MLRILDVVLFPLLRVWIPARINASNENRRCGRLYCGHGPVVESADKKIKYYINHRQEREDQIVETLTAARNQSLSSWQVSVMNKGVHERFKSGEMLRVWIQRLHAAFTHKREYVWLTNCSTVFLYRFPGCVLP